ncbi:MAG: hypothetical protein QOH50_5401 [Kribbellaceae bacterium]|nr:hypothetical protein [Kribbellaceae bacterium]
MVGEHEHVGGDAFGGALRQGQDVEGDPGVGGGDGDLDRCPVAEMLAPGSHGRGVEGGGEEDGAPAGVEVEHGGQVTADGEAVLANPVRDRRPKSIWLVTRRLKTKQEVFIPLKCPPIVSSLLAKYCLIVRPVESHIAYHLRGKEARTLYKEYLWVHNCELLQKKTFYNMVPDFLEEQVHERIGIHDYRQLAVEIGRVFLGSEMEIEHEELDVLAAQRGHSTEMARFKYASEVGHLPGLSSDLLLRFGRVAEKWWQVAGFMPGQPPLLPLKTRQKLRTTGTDAANRQPFDTTGLVPQLSGVIRESLESFKTNQEAQIEEIVSKVVTNRMSGLEEQLERIVTKALENRIQDTWLSGIPASPPPNTSTAPSLGIPDFSEPDPHNIDDIYADEDAIRPIRSTQSSTAIATRSDYQPSELTKDFLHHLLTLHFPDTPNPTFKSKEQMLAVELALAREENFVLVLPTGAGKSLVFTLPPFNELQFRTYVIVPNKALLNDHMERCNNLGIVAFQWLSHHKGVPDESQIVFLALESATSQMFRM